MHESWDNVLTIDVEEWFHPELVRGHLGSGQPETRLSESLPPLLDLLGRYGVKATFFILGEAGARIPGLVCRIHAEGHEIGCHGMSHQMLGDLGEEGLIRELEGFRDLMKGLLGDVRIKGFRSPTFSLHDETRWALPILRDFGYLYDSSIFPKKMFWNPLYGIEGAPRFPYPISFEDIRREDAHSPLWEFPAAVARIGGMDIPVSGGFFLRTIPSALFRFALRRINREGPFSIYLHPWECDMETPRIALSFLASQATYFGIRGVLKKLEELLRRFSFSRMDAVLRRLGAPI